MTSNKNLGENREHNREQNQIATRKSESRVVIDVEECKGCGLCVDACPIHVLSIGERFNGHGYHPARWSGSECTGCGVCFYACPEPGAITVYVAATGLAGDLRG